MDPIGKTMMAKPSTIEGVLERIVYFDEENNFTVAKLIYNIVESLLKEAGLDDENTSSGK